MIRTTLADMQYFVLKTCSVLFGLFAFVAPVLVVESAPRGQSCGLSVIPMLGFAGMSIVASFVVAFAFERAANRLRRPIPPDTRVRD
jgi:hypothetical protein